jgi:phage tail-like protein
MPTTTATARNGAYGAGTDPFTAYNFKLEIQGVTAGHFTECSGLGIEIDAISYREGGNQQVVHRVPGMVRYEDIVLRYGVTTSGELFAWVMSAAKGAPQRKNVSILILDSSGSTEVIRYNLIAAWPAAWRGAPLHALTGGLAIDTITLVFESLERG